MVRDIFKDEARIRAVGGKLERDYYIFKREVLSINEYYYELFDTLGLTGNINFILEALNNGLQNLCSVFIYKKMMDIEAGKIPKNEFLSKRMIDKIEILSPDEQVKIWKRETQRSLKYIYKDILDQNRNKYGFFFRKKDV